MITRHGVLRMAIWALVGASTMWGCRTHESNEVEVEIRSVGLDQNSHSPVVVLQDKARRVALPIWIGPGEAQAIALQLEGINPPRPMTHDLMKTTLEQAGVEFQRVLIADLKESTYYARIFLRSGRKDLEVDSRPSDAIALAVRFHKPIFVSRALLQEDVVIDLRQQAMADGAFTFGGITVQGMSEELANYFDVPAGQGVLIADVTQTAQAAVRRGDVILEVDGVAVADLSELKTKLDTLHAGSHADLSVRRGAEKLHVDLLVE